MKLMPPRSAAGAKRAKPTPKPARRKPARAMPAAMKKAMPDPDMDGDAGASETAVAEQMEPASNYAAASRKSRPTVI